MFFDYLSIHMSPALSRLCFLRKLATYLLHHESIHFLMQGEKRPTLHKASHRDADVQGYTLLWTLESPWTLKTAGLDSV